MASTTRILITFLFFICCTAINAQRSLTSDDHFRSMVGDYIKNNSTEFAAEELAYLDRTQLKRLRNLPYARNGLLFKDAALKNYFSTFRWYLGNKQSVSDSVLNKFEKENIANIVIFENARKLSVTSATEFEKMLSGSWQLYATTVAAGYDDRYSFDNSDRSFSFYANEMSLRKGLSAYSGHYVLDPKGSIEFDIREKTYLTPVNKSRPGSPKEIEWKEKVVNLDAAHDFITNSISEIHFVTIDGLDKMFLKLQGRTYWKILER